MSDKLPMTREQIVEEVVKCLPLLWDHLSDNMRTGLISTILHIVRIENTEIREENKRLNAFLAESCQEMRSLGPYDGSGPCPEIMRLAQENKRLRSKCKQCPQAGKF